MTRVLLVSSYELGAQPLGLAWPAAALSAAGHDVRTVDLAVDEWPSDEFAAAEAVCFSVPMHTAARLAITAAKRLRAQRPALRCAFYGLYAGVVESAGVTAEGDCCVAGEVGEALVDWLAGKSAVTRVDIGRASGLSAAGEVPRRGTLRGLEHYARLVRGDEQRLVGTVETTRGCNHRCRHCPVPVVYRGRSRTISEESVLKDIEQLVESGAGHIRFSDPDFLNRPAHAVSIARSLHARHPQLSFDATIKVSHILRHQDAVAELAESGLCFVVSAFESMSPLVLERLAKGHSAGDCASAVGLLRRHGIEIRPSFLPFTPWTRRDDVVEILDFVARNDLVCNVDPVQYSIRLLVPPGSLLLADDPTLAGTATDYLPEELGHGWAAEDRVLDEMQQRVSAVVEQATADGDPVETTYAAVRATVFAALGGEDPGAPLAEPPLGPDKDARPRLSEAWFCCAEPTRMQLSSVVAR